MVMVSLQPTLSAGTSTLTLATTLSREVFPPIDHSTSQVRNLPKVTEPGRDEDKIKFRQDASPVL
jgi:hypothetical protein